MKHSAEFNAALTSATQIAGTSRSRVGRGAHSAVAVQGMPSQLDLFIEAGQCVAEIFSPTKKSRSRHASHETNTGNKNIAVVAVTATAALVAGATVTGGVVAQQNEQSAQHMPATFATATADDGHRITVSRSESRSPIAQTAKKANASGVSVQSTAKDTWKTARVDAIDTNQVAQAAAPAASQPSQSAQAAATQDAVVNAPSKPLQDTTVLASAAERSEVGKPANFNPNHATGDSGLAYAYGQCTWWAYLRRHQLGLPVGSYFGNARNWAASARSLGYWVDNVPQVGDIVVFQPGQAYADPVYGHVAVVEQVNGNSIVISESSAGWGSIHYRTVSNINAYSYIHY